ncbi:hypothetical protein Q3G72_011497 [Acer saccharum]|nr:hypothetical protein Q3G72_011497 [Acer saccharum]
MEEDLVNIDTGALLMQQCLCAERQQFEEEDQAETGDELQLDGEEMANKDWVEGDVGPLLMVRPAVITIIDDVKPKIVEEKCYSAPKFDKEVVLGRGNTTEIGRGDTAEEQGTTMVERPVCFTPRAAFATITNVDEQASRVLRTLSSLKRMDEISPISNCNDLSQPRARLVHHACGAVCAAVIGRGFT